MTQPKLEDKVLYWPTARAPQGPLGKMKVKESAKPMQAVVTAVHNPRLVDLSVVDHGKASHAVRFVPFLYDGDPDPDSPTGRCQLSADRKAPGLVIANAGRPEAFTIDPANGEVGDVADILSLKP